MSLWLQVEQSLFLVYFNLLSKVKSKIIAKKERNMLIIIILNYWCTRDDNGTFFRLVMCQWGELTAGHTRWSEMGGAWSSRFERTLNATWVDVAIVEQKLADIRKCYRKNNPLVQHLLSYLFSAVFFLRHYAHDDYKSNIISVINWNVKIYKVLLT